MNHRRSIEGYHSSWRAREQHFTGDSTGSEKARRTHRHPAEREDARRTRTLSWPGLLAVAVVLMSNLTGTQLECAEPTGEDVRAARQRVLDQVNQARVKLGLRAVGHSRKLEQVGDAAARNLLDDGLIGHVGRDGVPPFIRWALAGGSGFHTENAANFETTGSLAGHRLGDVLVALTNGMLAEEPPEDGHRRALLDPWVTHLGVGVAVHEGRVVMNHQLAVNVVEKWQPPPTVALPGTTLQLTGRLPPNWRIVGLQIRRDSLPRVRELSETPVVTEVRYPPQAAMLPARPVQSGARGRAIRVDAHNAFQASWEAGSRPGVELVVLWARNRTAIAGAVPVALAATVIHEPATLPDHLARWADLAHPHSNAKEP